MVKHADNIEGLLKVNKVAVGSTSPRELIRCREFLKLYLKKYLVHRPINRNFSQDEAFAEIKKTSKIINSAANRIAKVISSMKVQKENGVPDTIIDAQDIFSHQKEIMKKLKKDAENMLLTLAKAENFPMSIGIINPGNLLVRYPNSNKATGVRRLKKESLSETLSKLYSGRKI